MSYPKVKDVVKWLKQYDQNLPIKFYCGPHEETYYLSDYLSNDKKTVCVDIAGDE